MGMILKVIVLLTATTVCWPAFSQVLWTPVTSDAGVTVYTKKLPGRSYHSFKAVSLLPSPPAELAEVLEDVAGYQQWFAYLNSVKLLRAGLDEKYVYMEIDFPWPFANEDMIFRVSANEAESGDKQYLLHGVPSFAPTVDGIKRMRDASGYILLERNGEQSKLTFVMHMELSGAIPPWLANRNIHFLPLKTLHNLAKISGAD